MTAARILVLAACVASLAGPAHAAPPSPGAARADAPESAHADPSPMRAIAIAEDRRDWSGGDLRRLLADSSAVVRARAALAVGRLQDSAAAPALLPLLADPSAPVRREAVFALGQIGWKGARVPLERSLGDADAGVGALAVEALGKLGDMAATPAVVRALDASDGARRAHAAVALWRLADTSAARPLLRHLRDRDAAMRWRVVYALEKLPLPVLIAPSVEPLLGDRDALVRAHAARTLGRLKARRAEGPLLAALADSVPAVRVNALRALQQIADSADAAQLPAIAGRLSDADPHVRVTAATVLADSFAWGAARREAAGAARLALRRGLADPDPATRGASARALIARTGSAGLQAALPLLADPVVYARTPVLEGLRLTGDAALAAPVLAGSIALGRPLLERMTAAEIAGQLGGRTHAGALDPLLDVLRAGVDDPQMLFAAACAGALGDWGDSASVGLLARAYAGRGRDADADARIAIRDALRQLAGRAFADSVEAAGRAAEPAREYAAGFELAPRERGAVIHTDAGDIEWAFDAELAPQTVRNFVTLARRGYFDGTAFHRVVPDFVIQDGDPTGTGAGGPGWTIRCEYNPLRYETGRVGMALAGKDTGGSQWFITLSPQPHLDGRYTIFARVVRGLEVVQRVTQGAKITRVEILE
ncbi:MAG: HEAT repeat domain-containing protein [Candidatus Eisenbacteria bacterium]|nr:HEAT repeat domain-containing protein [Candidatus Eisenbacteria bacterium]